MDDWEKEAQEMLEAAMGTDEWANLDKYDWEKEEQELLAYGQAVVGDRIIYNIQPGNVRHLKRRPMARYWERPDQISKPAGENEVREFLSVKDDIPENLKGKLWIAFAILAGLFLILLQ